MNEPEQTPHLCSEMADAHVAIASLRNKLAATEAERDTVIRHLEIAARERDAIQGIKRKMELELAKVRRYFGEKSYAEALNGVVPLNKAATAAEPKE